VADDAGDSSPGGSPDPVSGDRGPTESGGDVPPEASPAPPPGQPRRSFWRGLLWFGAPIVVLSLLSTAGGGIQSSQAETFFLLWFVALLFLFVALVGAIVLHVRGHKDAGNGALTAMGLGLIVLFGTCVVNLTTM
jgi:hypothetical protein